MSSLLLPLLLGLAHGVSDSAAGWLLGRLPVSMSLAEAGLLVLLYNAIAFGAQPLVGALIDQWRCWRLAVFSGVGFMVLALWLNDLRPQWAIISAGLGSAVFHVSGGALAMRVTPGRTSGPGLFAAPGVVGLAIGGMLAMSGYPATWPFVVGLLGMAIVCGLMPLPFMPTVAQSREASLERHDWLMMALLTAIALRSAIWNVYQFVHQGETYLLLWLAVAAAIGKVLGGLCAEVVGWKHWTLGVLGIAAPLLALGGQSLIALLLGVALLQSTTPVMWVMLARLAPQRPATVTGLALGLAIAIGGIPAMGGLSAAMQAPLVISLMLIATVTLFIWALRRMTRELRAIG